MLLQRMFVIDPDERIDIDGVLNHGFFHENLVIRKWTQWIILFFEVQVIKMKKYSMTINILTSLQFKSIRFISV